MRVTFWVVRHWQLTALQRNALSASPGDDETVKGEATKKEQRMPVNTTSKSKLYARNEEKFKYEARSVSKFPYL